MKNTTSLSNISGLPEFQLTEIKTVPQFSRSRMLGDRLGKLWNYLVAVWWYSEEPRIHQKQDKDGNWIYHIYDPLSHKHFTCDSEHDVRVWLDERYYQ